MEALNKSYNDTFLTIEHCINNDRYVPAQILIYSSIDSFSNVCNRGKGSGRSVFKSWVKKWMLDKYPLPCNEVDLYSARCALLHTKTSESDLVKRNEAREIYICNTRYDYEIAIFQVAINESRGKGKVVALDIKDLYNSFKAGYTACLEAIRKDSKWEKEFKEKAKKYFMHIQRNNP